LTALRRHPLSENPIHLTHAWAIYVDGMNALGHDVTFGEKTDMPYEDLHVAYGGRTRVKCTRGWAYQDTKPRRRDPRL